MPVDADRRLLRADFTVRRTASRTASKTASDLLVAVALLHGADLLAGGQVAQEQRAPGGVVSAVVKGLPSQNPRQGRQLRRTRFDANTRRIPSRVYWATFVSRPRPARGTNRTAAQTWSWFSEAGR